VLNICLFVCLNLDYPDVVDSFETYDITVVFNRCLLPHSFVLLLAAVTSFFSLEARMRLTVAGSRGHDLSGNPLEVCRLMIVTAGVMIVS